MIVDTIIEAMKVRGVKASSLAEQIGIGRSSLSLFLNRKQRLNQEKIEAIFKVLKITLVTQPS